MRGLQKAAEDADLRLEILALPGTFMTPDRELVRSAGASPEDPERLRALIREHFVIGRDRTYEDDPRFGLVVLSQIGGRALSPAMNDPGTAIDVIGVLVRLFVAWNAPRAADPDDAVLHDRISVPSLDVDDMFDDAFTAIARDGGNAVEVVLRLLRGLETLARIGDPSMRAAALRHAERIVALADRAAHLPADRALIAERAAFSSFTPLLGADRWPP